MITIKEKEFIRDGVLHIEGNKISVKINDFGENLEEGKIPNHDKIEIIFQEE